MIKTSIINGSHSGLCGRNPILVRGSTSGLGRLHIRHGVKNRHSTLKPVDVPGGSDSMLNSRSCLETNLEGH